jgi:hypothetical protein
MIAAGGEIERGLERPREPDQGRRLHALAKQPVAPCAEVAHCQQTHGLRRQRRGEVLQDAGGVLGSAPAGGEVAGVFGHRVGDGYGTAGVGDVAPRQPPRPILGLPESKHVLAVGVLVIVGGADLLGPVAALAVGDPHHPDAGTVVAAVAERDPGRDRGEIIGLPADLELEARSAGFEARSAGAASHWGLSFCPALSRFCPGDGRRVR